MSQVKLYNKFSEHLKETFGCRVYKISINAGFTCPNRNGTKGIGGCIYCDEFGSGNRAYLNLSIPEQIKKGIEELKKKYKAEKFIAYFQAFSNTYASPDKLKKLYDEALQSPDIVGLSIGTRPDCVNKDILAMINEYTEKYYVWIEYGLQSASDETLRKINRGHSVADFINAVKLTKNYDINICAHIILGLPFESKETMLKSADLLNELGIDGVKIHSLYVVKNSGLAELYQKGQFQTMTQEEYVTLAVDYLERLSPSIIIQRLTGETYRDLLIAPDWTLRKNETIKMIEEELKRRNSYQGKKYLETK